MRSQLEAYRQGRTSLAQTGSAIRRLLRRGRWPTELAQEICRAYRELSLRYQQDEVDSYNFV